MSMNPNVDDVDIIVVPLEFQTLYFLKHVWKAEFQLIKKVANNEIAPKILRISTFQMQDWP